MAIQAVRDVIPYAVNFGAVVVILGAVLRKPTRKFIYQRHERMKDAIESAAIAHRKADDRARAARKAVEGLAAETSSLAERERRSAEAERAEIAEKAEREAERLAKESDRLAQAEQEESSERVKEEFLAEVVSAAEESLRRGLKRDDHSAILKNAQKSIEVGV
jgi:F0F1-type ATP synthase membrane subunit b/b'